MGTMEYYCLVENLDFTDESVVASAEELIFSAL